MPVPKNATSSRRVLPGRGWLVVGLAALLAITPTGASAGSGSHDVQPLTAALPAASAASRGADLWFNVVTDDGRVTDCVRLIRVDGRGQPVANMMLADCPGQFRDVYAGVRVGVVGEYDLDAPWGLWNRAGFLGTLQGSRQACFTTGGDLDWAAICMPVSANSMVISDLSARGVLTQLSLNRAPRVLARVPAIAGAVMSHNGRTLYGWSSQYLVSWSGTGGAKRDAVSSVDMATGRVKVITRAPAGQQYRLVCSTWAGRLIAVQERRTGMLRFKPVRLVSITPKGRVSALSVPWGVVTGAKGCTADGRTIVYTHTAGTGTYDRIAREYHPVSDDYAHVDNS